MKHRKTRSVKCIEATRITRAEEEEIFQWLEDPEVSEKRKKELRDDIVMSVYPLVIKYAGAVKGTRAPFEDLTQAGVLGAMKALEKFDPKKGFRFSTYADMWIKDHIWKLAAQERTILSASGLCSSDREDSPKLDIRVAYPDGDLEERDPLVANAFDVEQTIEDLRNVDKLDDWIKRASLNEQETTVLQKVYHEGKSLAEAGRDMGRSRARIWQVHQTALEKLRKAVSWDEETEA